MNFFLKLSKILIIFSFPFSCLFASFQTIESISALKPVLDKADNYTLVIFDIDQTILMPANPCYKIYNIREKKNLLNDLKLEQNAIQKQIAHNLIGLDEQILLTPKIKEYIEQLQSKKVHVIACSAVLTGQLSPYKDILQRRIEQLKNLGIDFSKTSPFNSAITFDNMKPYLGNYPEAKDGVICTNGVKNTKAEVIIEYLKYFRHLWKPHKIIFIDDVKSFVEQMDKAFRESNFQGRNISATCIHYTQIDTVKKDKEVIRNSDFIAQWTALDQQSEIILKKRLEEKSYSMFKNLLKEMNK